MALIICKECRRQFSDLAPACPGCGAPTSYSVDGTLPPSLAATEPAQPAQVDAGPELTELASDVTETAPLSAYQFVVEHTLAVDHETTSANHQYRAVSPLLLLGIVFLPWLFYWLLLRDGHSSISRISGFLWLLLCSAGLLLLSYGLSEREAPLVPPVSESTQAEQPTEDLSNPVFYPLSGKSTDTASSPEDTTPTADSHIAPADTSQPDYSQPPLGDSTIDTSNNPSASIYSSNDTTGLMQQKLTDCLQQQADTGSYTLFDNGKSVAKMISVCYSDFKPWFDQCLINKHDAKTCNLDAIDITSSILRLKEQ